MSREYSYDMALLTGLLKQWGDCLEKFYNFSGLPSSDILYKAIFGHSGDGTGLPIPDCPMIVVQLSYRINALGEWDRAVITARYAMNLSDRGYYTTAEKAEKLGLTIGEFNDAVYRAKCRLLKTYSKKILAIGERNVIVGAT